MPLSPIGILGGMGPLATTDFMNKVIAQTKATCDQDHVPMIVYSVPQVPDRTSFLLANGESPLPALIEGIRILVGAGVGCIAIPCNTAHYWYDSLAAVCRVPIWHMPRICVDALAQENVASVGLMATTGTINTNVYGGCLKAAGIQLQLPPVSLQADIMRGIHRVKSGWIREGGELLEGCMKELLDLGVDRVILGCTEIPPALDQIKSQARQYAVDATNTLAEACIRWYREQLRCFVEQPVAVV